MEIQCAGWGGKLGTPIATRFRDCNQIRPGRGHARVGLDSADPARHAAWLREFIELGFEELLLHQVGTNQREFIDVFGREVLPQLRE
jgi:hypothetical protein